MADPGGGNVHEQPPANQSLQPLLPPAQPQVRVDQATTIRHRESAHGTGAGSGSGSVIVNIEGSEYVEDPTRRPEPLSGYLLETAPVLFSSSPSSVREEIAGRITNSLGRWGAEVHSIFRGVQTRMEERIGRPVQSNVSRQRRGIPLPTPVRGHPNAPIPGATSRQQPQPHAHQSEPGSATMSPARRRSASASGSSGGHDQVDAPGRPGPASPGPDVVEIGAPAGEEGENGNASISSRVATVAREIADAIRVGQSEGLSDGQIAERLREMVRSGRLREMVTSGRLIEMLEPEPEEPQGEPEEEDERKPDSAFEPRSKYEVPLMGKMTPILVILAFKFLYMYYIGLLAFLGFALIFVYCNGVVKRELARTTKKSYRALLVAAVNGITPVVFVHIAFERKVYGSLAFTRDCSSTLSLLDVFWIIMVNDYTIKMGTILIKIIFIALPGSVLEYQNRGKCMLLVEMLSQFYRTSVTMPVWIQFLACGCGFGVTFMDVAFVALYGVFKSCVVWFHLRTVLKACASFYWENAIGYKATKAEVAHAGNMCAICQDQFTKPSVLPCRHIFCEYCICTWMDKDDSCPMCRTKVQRKLDAVKWRDGDTAALVNVL